MNLLKHCLCRKHVQFMTNFQVCAMIFGQYGTGNMSDQVAVINSAISTIFHFVNFHLPI